MVRTLFALGLKPHDDVDIVRAGLESKRFEMLDLLASSGVPVNASTVALYQLTDDLTRFLVPKYMKPNDSVSLGTEPCAVAELFDLISENQDGCESPRGRLWLHFVLIGNDKPTIPLAATVGVSGKYARGGGLRGIATTSEAIGGSRGAASSPIS